MRFRFDANQEYQVRAIEAVADVFQGQARVSGAVRFQLGARVQPGRRAQSTRPR